MLVVLVFDMYTSCFVVILKKNLMLKKTTWLNKDTKDSVVKFGEWCIKLCTLSSLENNGRNKHICHIYSMWL